MITKKCENCGNQYKVVKSRAKTAKYCSNECRWESSRNKVGVECDGCGKVMKRHPSLCKQNERNFCSQDCYHKSKKKGEYRNCKECGEEFYVAKHAIERDTPRGNCCSRECFYKYNQKYPNTLKLRAQVVARNERKKLEERYVKSVINQTTGVKFNNIPQIIVEAKRQNLKIKRLIRNKDQ